MSLQFVDGFDAHGATANLARKWTANSDPANVTWNATAGRFGGGALVITAAQSLASPLLPTSTPQLLAFHFKVSAAPASLSGLFQHVGGDGRNSFVQMNTSGQLVVNSISNNPYATTASSYADNAWHWLEIKRNWSGSNTLHIDGTQVASFNSSGFDDPGQTGTGFVRLYGFAGRTVTYDDVIIWDNTGTNWNATTHSPIGIQQIQTLYPTGAGTTTQYTPNTGANWDAVNDTNPDDATTYVQDSVTGHRDLYAMADLTGSPTLTKAVVWNVMAQNPGSGAIPQKPVIKSGATTTVGSAASLATSYGVRQAIYEKDVAAGTPDWTPTTVNALELGYEIG